MIDAYSINRLLPGLMISVAIMMAVSTDIFAAEKQRPEGVFIPVLKNSHAGELGRSRWVERASGSYLEVDVNVDEAWSALRQSLKSFGILEVIPDSTRHELLTDWVFWVYKNGTGKSKPGFSLGGAKFERHKFRLTVKAGESPERSIIFASDLLREQEVDKTPDSEHSWMEWQQRDSQQGAADTFLQRLRLPIESALVATFIISEQDTRIVAVESVAAPETDDAMVRSDTTIISAPVISQVQDAGDVTADQAAVAEQQVVSQPPVPETKHKVPVTPTEPPASIKESAKPDDIRVDSKMPVTPAVPPARIKEGVKTSDIKLDPAVPSRQSKSGPSEGAEITDYPGLPEVAGGTDTAMLPQVRSREPTVGAQVKESVVAKTVEKPASNGLLVRAAPAVAWPALLQALNDLDIPPEQLNDKTRELTSPWVDAKYRSRNQVLDFQSKKGPLWAFSLKGDGIQRHKFRLAMVSASGGTQSIIYAWHTDSQELVDETPDSEQTLLRWDNRVPSADVAVALLRKLRIVIPR